MPKECDPTTCPTGTRLDETGRRIDDITKSLDQTSRLYVSTHEAIVEQTTAMKYMAEASMKREAAVDKDIDTLYSQTRKTEEKIAKVDKDLTTKIGKKLDLGTVAKGLGIFIALLTIIGIVAGLSL
jgi:hypothetical protein